MKRIKIATNTNAENKFNADLISKVKAFKDAEAYLSKWIKIDNKVSFAESFTGFLSYKWGKEYKTSFPSFVPTQKQFEMSELSLHLVESLEAKFKAVDIPLNVETLEPINKPDFGIYVEGSDADKFNLVKSLCEAINKLKPYTNQNNGMICQALSGAIIYDFTTQTIQPNIQWLTNERIR